MRRDVHSPMRTLVIEVIGVLLLLAGITWVAMHARELQRYQAAVASHAASLIDLGTDARPQAGQHGATVRVVATPTVVEVPRDGSFNLQVDTALLTRHVEMFQWREIRIGDSVHYELDWADQPLDALHFQQPEGHVNPSQWPIKSEIFAAGRVQMGGFTLSPTLARALPGSAPVTPDTRALPPNLAASFSRYQNYLVTSREPDAPQLGDLRVSWSRVPSQAMTIVARVDGDHLEAAPHTGISKGYNIEMGNVSLLDIFPDVPLPPQFPWLARVAGVVLAAFGALLLLWQRKSRPDLWLALGLGSLAVGLVTGALWFGHDPRMTTGWLLLALIGAALTAWRVRQNS